MTSATQSLSSLRDSESSEKKDEKIVDPVGRRKLFPDMPDTAAYFAEIARRDRKFEAISTCKRAPNKRTAELTQRFAMAKSQDRESFFDKEYGTPEDKLIGEALEHLTSSVWKSDPSVASSYITRSRDDCMGVAGSIPIDPIMDALNTLNIVAPSLLAPRRGVRSSIRALTRGCVSLIAATRPACWYVEDCNFTIAGEEVRAKTKVDWPQVRRHWDLARKHDEIWIDEIVFRILCGVPLQGGRSITEGYSFTDWSDLAD